MSGFALDSEFLFGSILSQLLQQFLLQMPPSRFLNGAPRGGDGLLLCLAFPARPCFDRAGQVSNLRPRRTDFFLIGSGVGLHIVKSSELETSRTVNFQGIAIQNLSRVSTSLFNFNKMNWEAINAVSQLVSSIAVVLSVLYLAIQLRSSTRVARVAAQDAAASALRDFTKPLMENAELGRVWRAGLEDLDALSPDDQARFFHAAHQFLKALETIHFHYAYGLLDVQLWHGWRELLRHYVVSPGIVHYLERRGEVFSQRFRKFLTTLEPVSERLTVGTLLGKENPASASAKSQS